MVLEIETFIQKQKSFRKKSTIKSKFYKEVYDKLKLTMGKTLYLSGVALPLFRGVRGGLRCCLHLSTRRVVCIIEVWVY